jgi:hypothetical protein
MTLLQSTSSSSGAWKGLNRYGPITLGKKECSFAPAELLDDGS